jgi:outer membrane protein OmpA-like peptidoglycan-associated protein
MKSDKTLLQSKTLRLILVFLCVLLLFNSSQASGISKKMRKADNYFLFSDYNKALPLYLSLIEKKSTDVNLNYRLGVCYLYSNQETFKCLNYFETARANIKNSKDSIPELFYYMGTAYRMANRFNDAIQSYNIFKTLLKNKTSDKVLGKTIDLELEQCIDGNELMQTPTNAKLTNLGTNVNSIYPDYAPVISADETMLIFTSKRKECTGNKITPDGNYYEDIFISKNTSDDWVSSKKLDSSFVKPNFFAALFASAKSIGKSINTNEHDASIALSADGKKLYIYRFNDIWQSEYKDGKWNKPLKLNKTIDGKTTHESSMTLTSDGNTIYFSSERDGGFGGKDLYVSTKQSDGIWGEPENLGPNINTEMDEDAPFIVSDKILYFSSQAHGSIGGFDVFKSTLQNNDWTVPENLGYPINSGADDIFFVPNAKQNKAFIATMRTDGIGNYDIYVINYITPSRALLATTYNNDLKPLDSKKATLVNSKHDSTSLTLNQTTEFIYGSTEKYKMIIPQYNNDTNKTVFEFKTPESFGLFNYYQEINYDVVENSRGQLIGYKTTVYNAFFDIEKELQKNKNRPANLKKEEEYAMYIRTLTPDNNKFQVFTSINYIDTSSLPLLALNTVKNNKTKTTKILSRNPNAFKTILFDFSKAELSPEAIADIEIVAKYLNENKNVTMEIVGHTDSKGLDLFNTRLSKKRASEIKRYLISEGIEANRLKAIGMGESQPVAANENADGTDNPEGRKQNRRVEFVTIK